MNTPYTYQLLSLHHYIISYTDYHYHSESTTLQKVSPFQNDTTHQIGKTAP